MPQTPADDLGETVVATRPSRARRWAVSAASWLVVLLVFGVLLPLGLRTYVGQLFVVPSSSMARTLKVGDRIVASKNERVDRGEVVVFADRQGWMDYRPPERTWWREALEGIGAMPSTAEGFLVKRVIGMPGDHVVARGGHVSVNGTMLDESSYVVSLGTESSAIDFDVVVPAGRVFVMGDHRDASADSRCHMQGDPDRGFVRLSDVVGVATTVVLPVDHARGLHVPETFASVPDPTGPAPEHARVALVPRC